MSDNGTTTSATGTVNSAFDQGLGQERGRGPERRGGRRVGDRLVVASASLQAVVDKATSVARSAKPVLISGPSGSGRRHLARAIHGWSAQTINPLVEAPLAGLSTEQQVASLCGGDDRRGEIAKASGSTLLIPSLEGLTQDTLQFLLETLRQGSYRPGGDGEATPLNTRIIATVDSASKDIFSGLAAQHLEIPGLVDRPEDILPLATHFLADVTGAEGMSPVGFTGDARRWLVEESWLGNARELRERIRQGVQLAGSGALSAEALMLAMEGDDVPSFKEAKRAFETRYVEGLLRRCSGNISRAARLAKKDRKDFYDVIRRTGVEPKNFRS